MSVAPSKSWQAVKRWLPGVAISLIAIFILFRVVSWQELVESFSSINLATLALAVGLLILSLLVRTVAWRILLGNKPTLTDTFYIINEGYLLNNLLPFKLGEVGRAVLMAKAAKLKVLQVLSTIIIERAFDVGILAGILLAVLPLAVGAGWAKPTAIVLLVLVILGFALLFVASRNQETVLRWLEQKAGNRNWLKTKILPKLAALFEGLTIFQSIAKFFECLALYVLCWLIWTLVYYVVLRSFFPHLVFWQAAFLEGILAIGVSVPSAPAGLGVYEATMVGALSLFKISQGPALAFAILIHLIQVATTAIFGFIGLLREGLSLGELVSQIRKVQSVQQTTESNPKELSSDESRPGGEE